MGGVNNAYATGIHLLIGLFTKANLIPDKFTKQKPSAKVPQKRLPQQKKERIEEDTRAISTISDSAKLESDDFSISVRRDLSSIRFARNQISAWFDHLEDELNAKKIPSKAV